MNSRICSYGNSESVDFGLSGSGLSSFKIPIFLARASQPLEIVTPVVVCGPRETEIGGETAAAGVSTTRAGSSKTGGGAFAVLPAARSRCSRVKETEDCGSASGVTGENFPESQVSESDCSVSWDSTGAEVTSGGDALYFAVALLVKYSS